MLVLVILAFAVTACSASQFQRIVNGENAEISDYPWQLSLQLNGRHICGAVLVVENIALTAAHCIIDTADNYRIVAGVTDLTDSSIKPIGIHHIIPHEQYSEQGSFPNDIAILFLNENLPKSSVIDPPNDITYEGRNCTITGWGLLSGGDNDIPNVLQRAYTNVLRHQDCQSRMWLFSVDKDKHVCVHTGQNGACNGDSGGPLVCYDDGIPKLVGLTSWGISGCPTFTPSVYTRVSNYVQWVNDNI